MIEVHETTGAEFVRVSRVEVWNKIFSEKRFNLVT